MTASSAHTFVIYSREDSQFVLEFVGELKASGVDIWIDQVDIKKGQNWDDEIQKAIAGAARVTLFLSPNSVESPKVKNEIAEALDLKLEIIPILIGSCRTPIQLNRLQYIDAVKDRKSALAEAIKALEANARSIEAKNSSKWHLPFRLTHGVKVLGGTCATAIAVAAALTFPLGQNNSKEIPGNRWETQNIRIEGAGGSTYFGGELKQRGGPINGEGKWDFLFMINANPHLSPTETNQSGISFPGTLRPNLLVRIKARPVVGVKTIDIRGCGVVLVSVVEKDTIFFWASEAEISQTYPVPYKLSELRDIALRQVGRKATAYIEGSVVAEFEMRDNPEDCTPHVFFKSFGSQAAEIEIKALVSREFPSRLIHVFKTF